MEKAPSSLFGSNKKFKEKNASLSVIFMKNGWRTKKLTE
jgi:hypothetical protein